MQPDPGPATSQSSCAITLPLAYGLMLLEFGKWLLSLHLKRREEIRGSEFTREVRISSGV